MSFKTEKVQIAIDVTTQKAVREIAKLQHEFGDLQPKVDAARKEVDKASKALEKFSKAERVSSNEKWVKAYDNFYKADRAYANLKERSEKYTASIEKQVKELGVAALTNKELNRYYTDQKRALDSAIRGTKDYEKALKNLSNAQNERFIRRNDVTPNQTLAQQLKGGFMPALIGGVAGGVVVAAQQALSMAFGTIENMIRKKAEFARAMGNLAAITGLDPQKDAKDLQFYAESARNLGKAFSESSVAILNTIAIVGSLKPELLKQKEALVAVTKDVITLSKASGGILTVEESAKAVTGALNQFNESAFQSTRYINVMAAGAKAGSSEISETAAAFKESGAILSTSNISFEESNALVQALSSKMIKGSEAGTNLRNIFSRLLTGTDELNPAMVGLNTALDNLSKLSPAEMVKMFGQESIVAAMTLVNMRKEVGRLTKEITGTTEATDAMATRMNNLDGDLQKFETSWSAMWHSMGSSSDGFWRNFITASTSALNWISEKMRNTKMSLSVSGIPILQYDSEKALKERITNTNNAKRETWNQNASKDVNDSNNYWLKNAQGKNLDEKKINASKETVRVARQQALSATAAYNKALRESNNKANVQELADAKNQALTKLKFAKEESQRLIKNAEANKKTVAKIKEGQARADAKEAQKHHAKTDAEKLAEAQLDTQARVNAEILRLQVERIVNENDKKEAQIRLQYDEDVKSHQQLVAEKKLSQAQFDTWLLERNKSLDAALIENDKQANEKAIEAAKKVNLKIAKERLKDEQHTLSKKLEIAKKNENLIEQESIEAQMLYIEKELELLESGEDRKLEILRKYEADKLLLKQKYGILSSKRDNEATEDAKKKLREMYEDIGKSINAVSQITGEFFNFQRQSIDNQQIQEDKRYNKQIANLEAQKDKGILTEDEYNTKKAEIDLIHNKKNAELKKKAWEADKQARIGQIIMATAQAVISALATGGIFGTVASIAAGVTGAAQLAVAMSQEAPDFEAFEKGDFTEDPRIKKPTNSAKLVWVNEKGPEFITNNNGVNSPDFPIMLPLLRKMNMGKAVFPDLRKMFMGDVPGFEKGDFTGKMNVPQPYTNTPSNPQNIANYDERLLIAIEKFVYQCENGTFAKVMFTHKNADDFNELLTKNIEVRKRASATKNGNIIDI